MGTWVGGMMIEFDQLIPTPESCRGRQPDGDDVSVLDQIGRELRAGSHGLVKKPIVVALRDSHWWTIKTELEKKGWVVSKLVGSEDGREYVQVVAP